MAYARPIQRLIEAFSKLPSVGERTAERYVFYLLKSGKKDVGELTQALQHLMGEIKSCETCWNFSDTSPCAICTDGNRDAATVCVVANPPDLEAIERIGAYKGLFHVLRGTVSPDDDDPGRFLKVTELLQRVSSGDITEVILALNPDMRGETTMAYLDKTLKTAAPNLKVSRLARGLPMGSDLQYADEVTLGSALAHRR